MKKIAVVGLTLGACLTASTSYAFMEEGFNHPSKFGYKKCSSWGDLTGAASTGCNPWPDDDANYSYATAKDMKKSSVHYNATAALAVAAGFNECAAYIIALWDEATDVGTDYDRDFYAPFPAGVSATGECAELLAANKIRVVKSQVDGREGGLISPDFTQRGFLNTGTSEVARESNSFHFNHADVYGSAFHECSRAPDPGPSQPLKAGSDGSFIDLVTLPELRDWAMSSSDPNDWYNPLNNCPYVQTDGSVTFGPVVSYNPDASSSDPSPGSLAALGAFFHSQQDYWSHKPCEGTTHSFGIWADSPCGFVSSHYAGEFGTINGSPATGRVKLRTPKSLYNISMHSDNTVSALTQSYELLGEYLALNPKLARPDAAACSPSTIREFAVRFASIPNNVPPSGTASGARQRSDLADRLFNSKNCTW